jgi:adenylate kinase family enzyme
MQRILVIGPGGSGKSTLSKRLGEVLGLPVIHLDSLYWKPGWVEPDKTEWAETVRKVIAHETWIVDGNYSGTLAERLEACDSVVFLDLPRHLCLWRVLKRVMTGYGRTRADMPEGCPEKLDLKFLSWVWNYPVRSRRKVLALLEAHRGTKRVVHLRTCREVSRFVERRGAS